MSPVGRGQQINTLPSAGGSTGIADSTDNGSVALPQREIAAWRAHLEHVADLDLSLGIGPGCAMSFALDADPVTVLARLARQRIAAPQSGRVRCRL